MGFVCPNCLTLTAMCIILISLIFQVICLSAPGWFMIWLGENGDGTVGFWQYCHEEPKYNCEGIAEIMPVEGWIKATRAFAVLALISLAVSFTSAVLHHIYGHLCELGSILPLVFALLSAMFLFVEFSVFSAVVERRKNTIGQYFHYGYCFALTITDFLLCLVAASLLCLGRRGDSLTWHVPVSVSIE